MFWLDVIESFICTVHDTKLWGYHPDLIYWNGLNRLWIDNTGFIKLSLKWNWFSSQLAWGWERLSLVSGLSRHWYCFQSPKKISRVLAPDISYYFPYCQFSFQVEKWTSQFSQFCFFITGNDMSISHIIANIPIW